MYYRYYSEGKKTKSTAYICTLGAVTAYIYVFILNIFKILYIDFIIPYWGIERWLNYILSTIIATPIIIILYLLYPPKKIKELNMSFTYNIYKNIFWIIVFIVMFVGLFINNFIKFW